MMNGPGPVSGSAAGEQAHSPPKHRPLYIFMNHKDITESKYLWLPSRDHQQQVKTVRQSARHPAWHCFRDELANCSLFNLLVESGKPQMLF